MMPLCRGNPHMRRFLCTLLRLGYDKGMRRFALAAVLSLVVLVVLLAGTGSGNALPAKQVVTAQYQFDLLTWELTHFFDKWLNQLKRPFTRGERSPEVRQAAISGYFKLLQEIRSLQQGLEQDDSGAKLEGLEARWRSLKPVVEEALEAAIDSELDELGIGGRLGPFRWPPVDFVFEASPLILVTSPKERVERLDDVILRPDLSVSVQEALEQRVEDAEDVSALVVAVGGVATYPAHVSPDLSLHSALVIASHEWLHHYLFFRPLGFGRFGGGELSSITETVANIAGEEIGDRVYASLTGQVVQRSPYQPPALEQQDQPASGAFDFRREMRETRLHLDELLADGRVRESEAYLEDRRALFVLNGYQFRKLNTAYFAFYGTYADDPASVSLVEPQLRAVRAASEDLAEFLGKVSRVTSESQLEELARAAGWKPESGE